MEGRKRVAWNLRRLRVERGLSQESLAVDAEVDRSYVGRLERAIENPTVLILERLVSTLNADICELFVRLAWARVSPSLYGAADRPKAHGGGLQGKANIRQPA
jgi:transcriptional regulator with XRE-family HTH domain